MSDIKRFDEVPNEFGDYEIEETANGEYMLYGVHAAVVKELEEHLADARKDQARLDFVSHYGIGMRVDLQNRWYMDAVFHTNIGCVDDHTRFKTSREAIDAAIKEQGK